MASATPTSTTTHVSAPGKVLITGGYLVLEPQYSGLVLSTTSRFHTMVTTRNDDSNNDSNDSKWNIIVESTQYHTTSLYNYKTSDKAANDAYLQTPENQVPKHYIEYALLFALRYALHRTKQATDVRLHIKITADNDFYSQRENVRFLKLGNTVLICAFINNDNLIHVLLNFF